MRRRGRSHPDQWVDDQLARHAQRGRSKASQFVAELAGVIAAALICGKQQAYTLWLYVCVTNVNVLLQFISMKDRALAIKIITSHTHSSISECMWFNPFRMENNDRFIWTQSRAFTSVILFCNFKSPSWASIPNVVDRTLNVCKWISIRIFDEIIYFYKIYQETKLFPL